MEREREREREREGIESGESQSLDGTAMAYITELLQFLGEILLYLTKHITTLLSEGRGTQWSKGEG